MQHNYKTLRKGRSRMTEQDPNPGDKDKDKQSDIEKLLTSKDFDPKDVETLKEILGNPEAVLNILKTKRSANAEAQKYRLELEQIEDDKKQKIVDDLKGQNKYKALYENNDVENKALKAELSETKLMIQLKRYAGAFRLKDEDYMQFINRGTLRYDSAGNITLESMQEAVSDLFKIKPDCFIEGATGKADTSKPGTKTSKPSGSLELAMHEVMHQKPKGN